MIEQTVEERIRDAIRQAGYYCAELVRVYPPLETGIAQEVLFQGHKRGGDAKEQLTAYVVDGVDRGAAEIAVGW